MSVAPTSVAALVREVSPRIADGELSYLQPQPVDLDRARAQHAAYVEVMRDAGLEIVQAPALDEHPDGVFVEDAVVVIGQLAVLARSGAASRRGEADSLRELLATRGLRIEAITDPATLDGGDVFQVDDTVFVGRTARTNEAAIERLRELAATVGREVVAVDVDGVLHLKSAATALPDGRILANLGSVDAASFGGREIIQALEPSGSDVLLLGDTVVLAASAPLTAAMVREQGYEVRTVDISELEKLEAGPTCPSVLLPAARPVSSSSSWRLRPGVA